MQPHKSYQSTEFSGSISRVLVVLISRSDRYRVRTSHLNFQAKQLVLDIESTPQEVHFDIHGEVRCQIG